MTVKVGLSMIVSDRPEELVDALNSAVDFYDELHVTLVEYPGIDYDEMMRCKAIVESFGGDTSVYRTAEGWNYPFIDDFGKARNQAMSHFSDDVYHIMWMDSDEILTDAKKLREILETMDHTSRSDRVKLMYLRVQIDGGISTQARIWIKDTRTWVGRIHETLNIQDSVQILLTPDIYIIHKGRSGDKEHQNRNFVILEESIKSGDSTAREDYYYALHLWQEGARSASVDMLKSVITDAEDPENKYMAILLVTQDQLERGADIDLVPPRIMEAMSLNLNHYKSYVVMGDYFRTKYMYRTAIQWYNMALNIPHDEFKPGNATGWLINDVERLGYTREAIAICYLELGNRKRAQELHAMARYFNPKLEQNDKVFGVQ